jgi:valyl-tRNA synthetase
MIRELAGLQALSIAQPGAKPKASATAIIKGAMIFVSLEGIIDFDQEHKRLGKEIEKLGKELTAVSNKLDNINFLQKAPPEIVNKVKQKYAVLQERQDKLQSNLNRIQELI